MLNIFHIFIDHLYSIYEISIYFSCPGPLFLLEDHKDGLDLLDSALIQNQCPVVTEMSNFPFLQCSYFAKRLYFTLLKDGRKVGNINFWYVPGSFLKGMCPPFHSKGPKSQNWLKSENWLRES